MVRFAPSPPEPYSLRRACDQTACGWRLGAFLVLSLRVGGGLGYHMGGAVRTVRTHAEAEAVGAASH